VSLSGFLSNNSFKENVSREDGNIFVFVFKKEEEERRINSIPAVTNHKNYLKTIA